MSSLLVGTDVVIYYSQNAPEDIYVEYSKYRHETLILVIFVAVIFLLSIIIQIVFLK